jgi:hypothetical protein
MLIQRFFMCINRLTGSAVVEQQPGTLNAEPLNLYLLRGKLVRNSSRLITIVSLLSVFAVLVPLEASQTGGLPGAYLLPSLGASALAMGDAYTASPESFTSWWNPGMLANIKGKRISGGAGMRSLGRTDLYAAAEFRVPPRLGMALLFLYRGDPFVNDLYDENEKPIGNANYSTFTGKISLSYIVTRKIGIGVNINILNQRLPTSSSDGLVGYSSATSIGAVDIGLECKINDNLSLAFTGRNLGASFVWETENGYYISSDDRPLPKLTVGTKYTGAFLKKPLLWRADLMGNLFDGKFRKLDRPQAQFCMGWEWQYWEKLFLRAGIGDILFNGDMVKENRTYRDESSMRVSLGCSFDASKRIKGLKINYGVSTDKVWAGLDHQLDFIYTF